MKILVEASGDFMLLDTSADQEVSSHRPNVAQNTNFISGHVAPVHQKPLWVLKDEATDARIGNAISRHIETLFNKTAIVAGAGIGLISIDYLGYEIGLWDKAEGIRAMLDIAKHLTH